jgi:cytoskeleton protein RodZ
MPPLDAGSVTHVLRLVDPLNERVEPSASEHPTLGGYLRAVREYRGLSISDIAASTRVAKAYLTAIEAGDAAALPARPFALGYVRAYARALDLNAEAMADRYRAEIPDMSVPLQAPIGVKFDRPERRPLFLGLAAIGVVAVVGWNIAQRAMTANEPPPPVLAVEAAPPEAPTPTGPISLGAPTPPPADQTTPAPYVTPGLAATPAAPVASQPPAVSITPLLDRSAPVVFTPKAEVHGVPAIGPTVVLHAKEAAALIVRGPTGAVHFARQLAAGESYRAPIGQRLTAEVTDPAAFAVYINNQLQGVLVAPQTSLDRAVAEAVASQPAVAAPAPAAPVAASVPAADPAPAIPPEASAQN